MSKSAASLKSMIKALRDEGHGLKIEYKTMTGLLLQEDFVSDNQMTYQELYWILKSCSKSPKAIPSRRCDHAITLKEGANLPNLGPYRHPDNQKAEIE